MKMAVINPAAKIISISATRRGCGLALSFAYPTHPRQVRT